MGLFDSLFGSNTSNISSWGEDSTQGRRARYQCAKCGKTCVARNGCTPGLSSPGGECPKNPRSGPYDLGPHTWKLKEYLD